MVTVVSLAMTRCINHVDFFFFLLPGVYELTHDNRTLSMKTINVVRQMTLYPELIASVLYQASGSEVCSSFLLSAMLSNKAKRFVSPKAVLPNKHNNYALGATAEDCQMILRLCIAFPQTSTLLHCLSYGIWSLVKAGNQR